MTLGSLPRRVHTRFGSDRLASALLAGLLVLPALAASASLLGRHWYASGDRALEVLDVGDVGGSPDHAAPPQPPGGGRLVASYDPLTPRERLEADRLEDRVRSAMGARAPDPLMVPQIPLGQALLVSEGAPAGDVSRLAALKARGSPYQVFFTPSGL